MKTKTKTVHYMLYAASERCVAVCACGATWPHMTPEVQARLKANQDRDFDFLRGKKEP